MSDFVHLHVHSHYSLLSALPRVEELVVAAKESGQRAIALTDNGNLYGANEVYKECKKQGIKPIIGVDLYVAPRTRHDKEHRIDNKTSRLVLLAKHLAGYQNLVKLVSRAHLEGFYYTPRADRELIAQYCDGLIAILPSFAGEPPQHLKEGDRERAMESISWYRETFGSNLYAEITHHPEIEGHEERMRKWGAFATDHHVPLVAAHDVYYMKPGDALARELVVKIKTGGHLDRDLGVGMEDFSFITSERVAELFKGEEDFLVNSVTIADNCNLELTLGKAILPDYPLPEGKTYDDLLRELAEAGIAERGLTKTPELKKRIDYELGIIAKKGFTPYFLVVADLLKYAREQHIFTNTRGSAAGSLVSYLCGVTTVDPVAFNLPFERFLNPDRPTAPDIDMDIADNRRDELIDYAREKYGADRVAQIGTFGTMMARAAVRDVSRALGHSYNVGDQIAKLIPFGKQGFAVTIDSALKEVADLRQVYENDTDAREVLDLAKKIEGNARHIGVHAAGVCIAPSPVVDFAPIQLDPKGGKIITQYDMYGIADEYGGIGLIKFDFLGLKNLSILADAVLRVKNRLDREVNIDTIPRDDKKTFEMLSRGDTLGVFQLSGQGMTSYLKDLEPSTIHDINAMVALYRPGPMAFIPDYISRKKKPELVTYLDPRMEEVLKPTYGVLIYQDDVMTIAVELAGYSWVEADKFRKAIGKKIPEEMKAQKERFITGCIKGGMKDTAAKRLWEQIETFAAYGFNKAHAVSYGNLAYQTAYMKANFSVDYMAALLTADSGDVEAIGGIVAECKRMGIAVLAPDVNESMRDFTVVGDATIRFGLSSIKNFGEGVAQSIIDVRGEGGHFISLSDFLARVTDKNLNKKSLEALIQSGALDNFGERGSMLTNIEALLAHHKEHMSGSVDQDSLFGGSAKTNDIRLTIAPKASFLQKLAWEKELLGLYISGHPLDAHKAKLEKQKFDIARTKEKLPSDTQTTISGIVDFRHEILTKNGEKMAFLTIADYGGTIEAVAFPRVLKEYGTLLVVGNCVILKGRISQRNNEISFVAEAAKPL